MAYSKRYPGGFVDKPTLTTPIDQAFLNAVETALLKLFDTDPSADGQVLQWINASTKYGPALLLNKNIDPAAGIVKSKLDFTGGNGIVNADIAGAAAIAKSKLASLAIVDADVNAISVAKITGATKVTTSTLAGGPPGGPLDGDIWIATAVDANGTRWSFQYNSGSASAYKWEFIGGSALFASVDTSENTGSTAYAALATAGPSVTAVRAGDYMVRHGSTLSGSIAATLQSFFHSYDIGGTGAVDGDAAVMHTGNQDGGPWSVHRERLKTGLGAGTALVSKYRVGGGAETLTAQQRYLSITPTRIS